MKEPNVDGIAVTASSSGGVAAGGVEAIFLSSADAEEGASGESTSITQELWRQKHAQQEEAAAAVVKKKKKKDKPKKQSDARQEQQPTSKDVGDSKQVPISNKHGTGQRTPVASESTSPGKRSKRQQQQHGSEVNVGEDGSSHQNANGSRLRKTRSVTDVDGERESQDSSTASSAAGRRGGGGRRMSISVVSPYHQYSMASSSRDSSRRSSATSIVISVSRPDSPLPRLIQRIGEETLSIEFLKMRHTAKTVHSASKFRHPHIVIQPPDGSIKGNMTSEETAANLIRMHKDRRNSMPTIPRLDLKEENEKEERKKNKSKDGRATNKRLSDGGQTRRSRRRRSSTGSSIQGFYLPASRPSSAMAGEAATTTVDPNSRPSSSATIVQLGKLSRPWTPARSPSPGSTGSGNHRNGSRNFFRCRTPTSMAAPLQVLNTKVNNILGCASNILDFYHTRADIKKEPDHRRQIRLLQSTKMNEANEAVKTEDTAQLRLINFRKKAGQANATEKMKEFKGKLGKPAKSARPAVVPPAETIKKPVQQPVKQEQQNAKPKQQQTGGKGNQKEKKTNSKMSPTNKQPTKSNDKSTKSPELNKPADNKSDEPPKISTTKLPILPKVTAAANIFGDLSMLKKENKPIFGNLSIPAGGSAISISSAVSSQSSGTNSGKDKEKGIQILKSMMSKQKNKTAVAVVAATAFGPKSPSRTKLRINKVLKMAKTAGMVARRKPINTNSSHNQSMQNNSNNNQGPPTLVNFFKRSNRTTNTDSRIPIKYETFTDKDRAAAVLLGDADIKTTLEKQLKSGTVI